MRGNFALFTILYTPSNNFEYHHKFPTPDVTCTREPNLPLRICCSHLSITVTVVKRAEIDDNGFPPSLPPHPNLVYQQHTGDASPDPSRVACEPRRSADERFKESSEPSSSWFQRVGTDHNRRINYDHVCAKKSHRNLTWRGGELCTLLFSYYLDKIQEGFGGP